jgi:hypothetical protein
LSSAAHDTSMLIGFGGPKCRSNNSLNSGTRTDLAKACSVVGSTTSFMPLGEYAATPCKAPTVHLHALIVSPVACPKFLVDTVYVRAIPSRLSGSKSAGRDLETFRSCTSPLSDIAKIDFVRTYSPITLALDHPWRIFKDAQS